MQITEGLHCKMHLHYYAIFISTKIVQHMTGWNIPYLLAKQLTPPTKLLKWSRRHPVFSEPQTLQTPNSSNFKPFKPQTLQTSNPSNSKLFKLQTFQTSNPSNPSSFINGLFPL